MPRYTDLRACVFVLLIAAAASCPDGQVPADRKDRGALQAIGDEAFATSAFELCHKMPKFVTEPQHFGASVRAVCTTPNRRSAQFEVTFNNPCKSGSPRETVLMTVHRSPAGCDKAYDPQNNKWGWFTTTPGNMRPLECPAGFRPASSAADKRLLTAFLYKQLTERAMPEMKRKGSRLFCKGGIQTTRFTYQNGCIQTFPKGVAPYVMAQGKVAYTCYKQSRTHRIGLDGEGLYRRECEWEVEFN